MLVRVHGEAVGRGDRSRYGGRANPRHFDRDARLGAGGKVPEQSAQRQRDAGLAAIARVPGTRRSALIFRARSLSCLVAHDGRNADDEMNRPNKRRPDMGGGIGMPTHRPGAHNCGHYARIRLIGRSALNWP